jgi:histidine ammonia-lyase
MQEDHVSMGWHAGRKLRKIVDNLRRILAIEYITAARASEMRVGLKPAPVTGAYIAKLRAAGVQGVGPDRFLSPELAIAEEVLR